MTELDASAAAAVTLSGIDVSHDQGAVDWAQVKSCGIEFAFAKATEGLYLIDRQFGANWQSMKNAGVVRGAYHFFSHTEDAAAQAAHFLATVQLGSDDLSPALDVESVLDIEVIDSPGAAPLRDGVQTWLTTVQTRTGRVPIIYTNPAFSRRNLGDRFGKYPLWVAEYGVSTPHLPPGWQQWTFWQWSRDGKVAGVTPPVDLNRFNGAIDDLRLFLENTCGAP